MPRARERKGRLPVISLFSGAMGLDLGLEKAGFQIAVAVECNPYAVQTIRMNRPGLPLIDKRIEDVTTEEILAAARLRPEEPVVVIGGPSCQVFSTAGQRRSLGDPRGTMFEHFIRVVREAQPRFFVMENVRGLLSAAIKHRPLNRRGPGYPPLTASEELGSAFAVVTAKLRELHYYVIFDILNAADFGVPQVRHRLVFIGSRYSENIAMPLPTHNALGTDGLKQWRPLRDAIGNLRENNDEYFQLCAGKEKYLKAIPPGGNWRSLPPKERERALGKAFVSWGGRSGFFRRLALDKPSPALTTRPDSKATSLCHPTKLRPLTIREYARIQQFPDSWRFGGSLRKKYVQIGNAVPIGLGKALGECLRKAIRSRKRAARFGKVECWNLELLARLGRRPRTIVNPPRMRKKCKTKTISSWLDGVPRRRYDALMYVPPEATQEFRQLADPGLLRRVPKREKTDGVRPTPRATKARRNSYKAAKAGVRLTAAE
jgi:DNA (cytosine-5)-methyltransferase 1